MIVIPTHEKYKLKKYVTSIHYHQHYQFIIVVRIHSIYDNTECLSVSTNTGLYGIRSQLTYLWEYPFRGLHILQQANTTNTSIHAQYYVTVSNNGNKILGLQITHFQQQ